MSSPLPKSVILSLSSPRLNSNPSSPLPPVNVSLLPRPEKNSSRLVPTKLTIPLAFPATHAGSNTAVIGNELTVVYQDALRVEPLGGTWTAEEAESEPGKLVLTTAADASDAVLGLTPRGAGLDSSTILDQVWVQTWISGQERRDRVVFRCRTSEPQLRIHLPQSSRVVSSSIEVAVDHRKVAVESPDETGHLELTVPVSPDASADSHVIEIWYRLADGRPPRGLMTIQAATLDALDHVQRSYWQLILPRDEIVAWGNQQMTAELTWENWLGWRRRPLLQQAELERWIGAVPQDAIPWATNGYLFAGFGAMGQLEVMTFSRTWLLLIASGVALTAGLLLMYLPLLRHPAWAVSAGIAILALALIKPEGAVLIGQAAALGIALAVVGHLVRFVFWREVAERSQLRSRAPLSDSKLMEVRLPRTDGSSRITTASAPAAMSTPAAEAKP